MKLETFFEKFDLIAYAPDAVPKMRELVLELAVQGKLVPQDPNDEPAERLIERVSAALPNRKAENPFLGPIDASITDETEYELPHGWAWLPLGHVGIWATGCGFPTQYQGEPNNEFLFCKVSDMNLPGNEVEIRTTVHTIDAEVMKKIRARANPVGTVIFPKIGGAIATHKRRLVIKPTIIDNNCSGIQPIGLTDHRWLLLFLRNLDLTKYQSGTSVPAVSQGALDPIRIGLPPLAEQKRIVAKVDELMALCDQLEAQQQERKTRHAALARASLARFADAPTPANLNFLFHKSYDITPADLRKSILTLAVQGKLSVGSSNPAEWSTVSMKDTCDLITDGEHATPQRVPAGVPLATAKNVRDGFLDMTQTDFVSPETAEKCWKRCKPTRGDILMVCVGATTGRVCLVATPPDMVLVRSVALLRPNTKRIEATFLDLFLRSPSGQSQIWGGVRQNAQPCLYLGKMSEFTILLPPLAEQRRIVAKVDQLMALVDELEAQLAASRATGEKLLAALVAELTVSN
ncbi:MAG: restriction endonuclease subunit S [Lentisphaeria bacterium]|nr:restriction endonuclease subunit S [Lentisphaeria bacterium]